MTNDEPYPATEARSFAIASAYALGDISLAEAERQLRAAGSDRAMISSLTSHISSLLKWLAAVTQEPLTDVVERYSDASTLAYMTVREGDTSSGTETPSGDD